MQDNCCGALVRPRKYGVIGDIRGKGLLMGIEFVSDLKTKEPFATQAAFGKSVGSVR